MATTFLQAMVSYFHNHPVLKASFRVGATGNPWVDSAPPPGELFSSLPLCVIGDFNETYEDCTERVYLARASFTLSIFAEGLVNTESLAADVSGAYEPIIEEPKNLPMDEPRICTGLAWQGRSVGREDLRQPGCDWVYRVQHRFVATYRDTYLGARK